MDRLTRLGLSLENEGACAGHQWMPCKGEILSAKNPANEESIATVRMATFHDYEKIIDNAYQGFLKWREVPAPVRGECIRLIAKELRKKKADLGALIVLECGKIRQEAEGEVQEMIDMADFAVGQSRMLYGKTLSSERKSHRMFEQWHPLGPIGVITAFNFPVAVWAWNAFIGAICGNTILWKPSHKVSLCAIAVQNICNKVTSQLGYDGLFSLFVTHDIALAQTMVEDKRLPLISFTGSTHVGRQIAVCVGRRLGRHILELSGNNALIVDQTCSLELAVPSIVFGAVGTAGQRCTSTRRVIVHKSRYQELVAHLRNAYRQVKIGDPAEKDTLMGPLIDQQAVENFQAAIQTITQLNGEILYGGKVLSGPGHFVEPTIVKAQQDWQIMKQETFAPILYLLTYDTLPQAITMQNDVAQGLSSALFTDSLKSAEHFLSSVGSDCGIANINVGTSGAEIGGAFGGEKETGGGREAGSDVWKYYMRRQTCTINWGDALPLAQGIKFIPLGK